MSDIRGLLVKTGQTTRWHPIAVEEVSPGVFALKTTGSGAAGGSGGVPEHHNANANIIAATVNFSGTTKHVQIANRSTSNVDTFISFDGGTNQRTIEAGETLDVDAAVTDLDISAASNGTPYEILALV